MKFVQVFLAVSLGASSASASVTATAAAMGTAGSVAYASDWAIQKLERLYQTRKYGKWGGGRKVDFFWGNKTTDSTKNKHWRKTYTLNVTREDFPSVMQGVLTSYYLEEFHPKYKSKKVTCPNQLLGDGVHLDKNVTKPDLQCDEGLVPGVGIFPLGGAKQYVERAHPHDDAVYSIALPQKDWNSANAVGKVEFEVAAVCLPSKDDGQGNLKESIRYEAGLAATRLLGEDSGQAPQQLVALSESFWKTKNARLDFDDKHRPAFPMLDWDSVISASPPRFAVTKEKGILGVRPKEELVESRWSWRWMKRHGPGFLARVSVTAGLSSAAGLSRGPSPWSLAAILPVWWAQQHVGNMVDSRMDRMLVKPDAKKE